MKPARPRIFWIATLTVALAALVLLREILLPFVAGMALAYLLAPLVDWLERIGFNRAVAALGIIVFFVGLVIAAIVLVTPILSSEVGLLIEKFQAMSPSFRRSRKIQATHGYTRSSAKD